MFANVVILCLFIFRNAKKEMELFPGREGHMFAEKMSLVLLNVHN